MTWTTLRYGVLIGFGLLACSGCADPDPAPCQCPAAAVINCGHRGTGRNGPGNPYPENTIPSFAQAAAEGADMVELDVQHSADGVLVVMHDDSVNRTTDGTGCVAELALADLQALDAARGTPLAGSGVLIPTLDEVLAAVDLPINIEIKLSEGGCPASDRAALAADVVAAIQADPGDRELLVSSFDFAVLEQVQVLDPSIPLGYLTLSVGQADEAAAAGFAALNVMDVLLTGELVAGVRALGLDVNVWTVNDPGRFAALLGAGVQMIITDEPDQLGQVRDELCASLCPAGSD